MIAPTYIVALILAAAWFVGAYFLLGRFTRNRRHLRFPIRVAFGGTVLAIGLWILINSFNGKTVHEQLVTGQKISQAQPTARVPEQPREPAPPPTGCCPRPRSRAPAPAASQASRPTFS